jgi:hypothetical protein
MNLKLEEVVSGGFDNAIGKLAFLSTAVKAIHQKGSPFSPLNDEEEVGFQELAWDLQREFEEIRDCVAENLCYLEQAKRAVDSLKATG